MLRVERSLKLFARLDLVSSLSCSVRHYSHPIVCYMCVQQQQCTHSPTLPTPQRPLPTHPTAPPPPPTPPLSPTPADFISAKVKGEVASSLPRLKLKLQMYLMSVHHRHSSWLQRIGSEMLPASFIWSSNLPSSFSLSRESRRASGKCLLWRRKAITLWK